MKKKRLITGLFLLALVPLVVLLLYLFTGLSVKSNIKHCQALYEGSPEDALICYMLDDKQHPENRSHIAIWTLGQIESQKALPHLKKLYLDDPKGKSCKGKHDSLLCQYEIYKAIKSIEKGRLLSFKRLTD